MTKEIKGVETLSEKELKNVQGGGILTSLIFAAVMVLVDYISDGELDGNVN